MDSTDSGCILTTFCRDSRGYARLTVAGKKVLHHRVVYCKHKNIPLETIAGKVVRHTCDNPSCVNPAHLILGTHKENTQDCIQRGRWKSTARLTVDQINQIRSRVRDSHSELATEFGVSVGHISKIVRGVKWKIN